MRFGFVGGQEAVKGFPLVREVFEGLESSDWELVLIDNTLNLGFASMDVSGWKVKGKISIQPAYGDATRDAFFNSIDVLLFPSQWMESYGLTVREALSRDVWVISTAWWSGGRYRGWGQWHADSSGWSARVPAIGG